MSNAQKCVPRITFESPKIICLLGTIWAIQRILYSSHTDMNFYFLKKIFFQKLSSCNTRMIVNSFTPKDNMRFSASQASPAISVRTFIPVISGAMASSAEMERTQSYKNTSSSSALKNNWDTWTTKCKLQSMCAYLHTVTSWVLLSGSWFHRRTV